MPIDISGIPYSYIDIDLILFLYYLESSIREVFIKSLVIAIEPLVILLFINLLIVILLKVK